MLNGSSCLQCKGHGTFANRRWDARDLELLQRAGWRCLQAREGFFVLTEDAVRVDQPAKDTHTYILEHFHPKVAMVLPPMAAREWRGMDTKNGILSAPQKQRFNDNLSQWLGNRPEAARRIGRLIDRRVANEQLYYMPVNMLDLDIALASPGRTRRACVKDRRTKQERLLVLWTERRLILFVVVVDQGSIGWPANYYLFTHCGVRGFFFFLISAIGEITM